MPKPASNGATGTESAKTKQPKTRKKPGASTAPVLTGDVSKYQSFTTETLHRSELKGAPYNPRHITERNKLKLREGLKAVGLVQPIVWNRRTGNIVGGHQRISQLDALEGTKDYRLTVAVVEVDETRERELNVLLNNSGVCGEWELDKLLAVLQGEIDMANTGFDRADFMQMFGEAPSQQPDNYGEDLEKRLAEMKDTYSKLESANRTKDDADFYNVVVFGTFEDRNEFLKEFGLAEQRYVDGRTLVGLFRQLKEAKPSSTGAEGNNLGVGDDKAEGAGKPT